MPPPLGLNVVKNGKLKSAGALGYMPDSYLQYPASSPIGLAYRTHMRNANNVQPINSLNVAQGKGQPIADVAARQFEARRAQKEHESIVATRHAVAKQIADTERALKVRLTVRDSEPFTNAMLRSDARRFALSIPESKRVAAIEQSPALLAAVLETDTNGVAYPELSGITSSTREHLLERTVEKMFPQEAAELAAARDALRELDTGIATAASVIAGELTASGAEAPAQQAAPEAPWYPPTE